MTITDAHPPLTQKPRVHPLAWILLMGTIVRIALWLVWSGWTPIVNEDARDYQQLATRLATVGDYADANGNPLSLRPPLYPAAVAGVYLAVGVQNDAAVRAVQASISLLTIVAVYWLAATVYDRCVATWAAGLFAFYPSLLGYGNLLLSEILFTFLVVAFSSLACAAVKHQKLSLLAAAGIAMGLAALARSIFLLFTPVVALYLLLAWQGHWSRRLSAAALPVALFAATIAPWAIRNTRVQQTLTFIDVMGGRNAMMGNYEFTPLERSWATITTVTGEQAWDRVLMREHGDVYRNATQGQRDKLALRHALRFMSSHPLLTAKRSVVRFFNFWQLERLLVAAAQQGYFGSISLPAKLTIAAVICSTYAAVLFAGIFGAFCWPPTDWRMHLFLAISILFPCAVHTAIFAHSRYHLPTMPLVCVYAAAAVVNWREIWSRRRSAWFILASIVCLIVLLGWVREFVFVDYGMMTG